MSRISECIDDFEQARLNTGQIFFIMLSLIPMCFLFPTWLVAKFIYEPWVEKLAKMREDVPEIPFLDKWPIILDWVLIITNTLLTAALSDYWLYRINTSGYIEIIGITGGIIKIFQMVNNTISRIMLKILKSYIKDENQRYREQQREIIKNIIKLKRVDNGLWKILDGISKSESEDNCIEMTELSRKTEFILPNRERIHTI